MVGFYAEQVSSDRDGQAWQVPVDAVDVNPKQPRAHFDDERQQELNSSVAAVGVLQPIVVSPGADERYVLVMGERRLRAAREAGLDTIPAVLRPTGDDELLPLALIENVHRQDLNPLELAASYSQLVDEADLTHAQIAELLRVDRSHVTRTLSLLRLPPKVQRRVAAGVLSASHAELLAGLPDPTVAELLADRIVAEGLSVHSVRELIAVGGLPGVERLDGREAAWKQRQRRPRAVPEDLQQLAVELGDRFDTRVRVTSGRHRGRIVVDFSDREDLDRILSLLRGTPPVT